ncbi:unannotated protein [freshwater metagenome]|uniref:Unannotated protein n=1 Tax=freshwater metagenome TaxID=449393 RepID=A0A6J7AW11_9ZZZZ
MEIHFLLPLITQLLSCLTAFVFIAAASEPASDSDKQYEKPFPETNCGKYFFLCSSLPAKIKGSEPNLFTAGISDEAPQTLATSSMIITVASESAPCPPYFESTCAAAKSELCSASYASCGKREFSSTSFANGAIFFSASARTLIRSASYSSPNKASIA